MNCAEFEALAPELARGGELDTASEQQARAHADGCQRCQAQLVAQQKLTQGLQALAVETKLREPSPRLEQALREAFRQNPRPQAPPMEAARSRWVRWGAVAAGVAVAVAMAAGILLVDHDPGAPEAVGIPPTSRESPTANARVEPRPVPPRFGSSEQIAERRIKEPGPQVQPKRPDPEAEPRAVSQSEVVTDFLPLLYEESWNKMRYAQLVRVSLPRSAMFEFGFPPPEGGGATGRVLADVLLAEDGTARAIRFVQPRPDPPHSRER